MSHEDTMKASRRKRRRRVAVPCLTVAHHPQARRVGDHVPLPALQLGEAVEVSRLAPTFRDQSGDETAPLDDSFVSRKPLVIRGLRGGGAVLEVHGDWPLHVDGQRVTEPLELSANHIASGVTMTLARRVVLVLHQTVQRRNATPRYGLVGASDGLAAVRAEIGQVADAALPVLLCGETGTGKELVARAIHDHGVRQDGPFIAVNIAAVPATMAASELFGHVRGAFTGAAQSRGGMFEAADGGTLFLDEIGETPAELQPMLLRVLETGVVQRLGGTATRKVDVRVVAATDANLDAAVAEGRFRIALLHRLQGYEIDMPPLRQRREDVGMLFVHFLRDALGETAGDLLETPAGEESWIDPELVADLVRYNWPGNARQLRNVARQLAVANANAEVMEPTRAVSRMLAGEDSAVGETAPEIPRRRGGASRNPPASTAEIPDEKILEVLRANDFVVGASAAQLGIAKNSLYKLIKRSPLIKKANELTAAEIEAARQAVGDDVVAMAAHLEVSRHGLQLRMRALSGDSDTD